jgi:hypothetical protein
VVVYFIHDERGVLQSEEIVLHCSSLIDNPDPKFHLNGFPEMDGFMWVNRADAQQMVFQTQRFLFSEDFFTNKIIPRLKRETK